MSNCEKCGCPIAIGEKMSFCPNCLIKGLVNLDETRQSVPPSNENIDPVERIVGPTQASRLDFENKYQFIDKKPFSRGGQGELWKVYDREFGREVAMKVLKVGASESPHDCSRFYSEIRIAIKLQHPGNLPIFDAGINPEGYLYYTTQLLPNTNLADIWDAILRGPKTPRDSKRSINYGVTLLIRVCEIMAYAHNNGVVHRDLKPGNVLVGAFEDVRVIDWGSAHDSRQKEKCGELLPPFVPKAGGNETVEAALNSPPSTLREGVPLTFEFAPPEVLRRLTQVHGLPDEDDDLTDVKIDILLHRRNALSASRWTTSILRRRE